MKNISLPVSFFPSFIDSTRLLGEISSVENTPNDFRKLTRISDHIDEVLHAYNVMFIIDGEGKRSFGK
jgi:hypothetical protein